MSVPTSPATQSDAAQDSAPVGHTTALVADPGAAARPRRRVIVGVPLPGETTTSQEPPAFAARSLPTNSAPAEPLMRRVIVSGPTPLAPVAAPTRATPSAPPPSALRTSWAYRSITGGLLAVIVGGLGEAMLFQPPLQGLGAGVIGLAMLLAAVAWSGLGELPVLLPSGAGAVAVPGIRLTQALVLRLAGIGLALLLAWGSILSWQAHPDAIFGPQGLLWTASMAVLVLACARWYPATSRETDLGPPWTRAEVLIFGGLVALSLFTRVAWLDDIPWRFHFDEMFAQQEAMHFYQGPMIPLFTTTWQNTSLPSLFFAFSGGLLHLTGMGLGGVRLGVALIGALTVIPTYGLARLLAGRTAAVVAGFAWAVSAVAIHYSRVSIINMTTAFAWAVCFYFLLRGSRSRRPGDFVWAGLAAGLSQYTYYGTRLLPYVLLAYGVFLAVFHFRAFRERLGHFALVAVGFVVGFGPLIAYFMRYPEMWAGRGLSELSIPPVIPSTWAALTADWNILAPLMTLNFLVLGTAPSHDTVYYAPFLLPAEAVLLLLGLGVLIWRWRQPGAFLLLLWAGTTVFVSTIVVKDWVPALAHWVPAFPAAYVMLALPVALWLRGLRRAPRRWWLVGCAVVAGGMAWSAAANAYGYLVTYPPLVAPDHSLEAAQGRFLAAMGPHTRVRVVGYTWQPYRPDVGALMAPDVPASDFLNPSQELPLVGDPAHDLAFLFYNDNPQYLSLIQAYYPGGQVGQLQTPGGAFVADTYRLAATQVMARHGVYVTLAGASTQDAIPSAQDAAPAPQDAAPAIQVPQVGALPPGAIHYPVSATWSGALFITGTVPIQLSIQGAPQAQLWVEGQPTPWQTPLQLDPGWVPFSVQTRLTGPTPLHLLVQQGADPATEPDTAHLWPQLPNAGLATTISGTAITHRIDPTVGSSVQGLIAPTAPPTLHPFFMQRDPDLIPLTSRTSGGAQIRWEGEFYSRGGDYLMELHTDAHALLRIDGAVLVNLCNNAPTPSGTTSSTPIALTPGWHNVHLDLDATGPNSGLDWIWTPPGGVRGVVPPQWLRHSSDPQPGAGVNWPDAPGPLTCPQ